MGERIPALSLNRPPRSGITSLGFGTRAAIWTQGCDIGCPGCISRDTHAPGGDEWEPEVLAEAVTAGGHLDGLTISGGEPFQQPEALAALLDAVSAHIDRDRYDILCFTGHRREFVEARHPEVVSRLDVLVDGRYRQDLPTDLPLRGSANQRLHRLTPLARDRYGDFDRPQPRPPLQVLFDGEGVEWVGIPARGEMARIDAELAANGIRLGGASWRS